ncbi:dihydroorotate dehydrogenase electron transfer subunit [Sporolactobacillus vineae]|uniref:dihydroorotate dehydrogenase electron transfer subunit n=1 Tax=Sporolactobacillus vineae TaxID=444463 RepID=UPI0002892556|nr:dihydroorotate dehydrogenase electron transfer subunit [Sporolactobacillus vineae]
MIQEEMVVTAQTKIADGVFELRLSGRIATLVTEPGQFVHMRVPGESGMLSPVLRRPISICSVDPAHRELTLIYRVVGLGSQLLSNTCPGMKIDVFGPLGHGFPVDEVPAGGRALMIGGGVGVPPLYGLAEALTDRGIEVTHILGFRSDKDIFYEAQFAALGETVIFTDDGSHGRKGLVTDAIGEAAYDVAYACGPLPMLKAVQNVITEKPLFVSMEQRMGCGFGACLACAVHTTDAQDHKGYRRVCCDGPVFRAGEVELC